MLLLYVAIKDFKIVLRDRGAFITFILVPIILVLILGFSLSSVFDIEESEELLPVVIVDKDNSIFSGNFINRIREGSNVLFLKITITNDNEAEQMLGDDRAEATIIIPKGFSDDITDNTNVKLVVKMKEGKGVKSSIIASSVLCFAHSVSLNYKLANAVMEFEGKDKIYSEKNKADIIAMQMESLRKELVEQVVKFNENEQPKKNSISSMAYYSIAMLILFVLSNAFAQARTLIEEKHSKTLTRIMVAGTSTFNLLFGKILSLMVICLGQALLLILLTSVILRVNWGTNIALVVLLTVFLVFASGGIAIFVVGISKTASSSDLISNIFIQASTALGGGMIPLHVMSKNLNIAAMGTINWWAYKGYEGIMFDNGVRAILPFCCVLGIVGILTLSLGTLTFNVYENK